MDHDDDFLEALRQEQLDADRQRGDRGSSKPVITRDDTPSLFSLTSGEHAIVGLTESEWGGATTNARIAKLLRNHAPKDWEQLIGQSRVERLIDRGEPVEMIVLSADIRRSTRLMRETVDFKRFADIISGFVTSAARFIRWGNGWFDKFTGDGLLAYWIVERPEAYRDHLQSALQASYHIISTFKNDVMRDLKSNSHNFPAGVGLSLGLDSGPTYLVQVAGNLTVVGHPVVGAVRMCNAAANPWELMCNLQVGERLERWQNDLLANKEFHLQKMMGKTKEYDAQEAYLVLFGDFAEG